LAGAVDGSAVGIILGRMHSRWRYSHIRGFLELGLIDEAAQELAQLPAHEQDGPVALALRAAILQEQQRWPELATVAAELVRQQPAEAGWWIAYAYAIRRSQSLREAEAILREAEQRHPKEATIQFNLGCYACQRGDLNLARERVTRAIALDGSFREAAGTDPDLAPLRAQGVFS
jgi:predicted Zn-dependent protease